MKWTKAQGAADETVIEINDFIGDWIDGYWGFGVTAKSFVAQLQDMGESKNLRVVVNSPGGDVMAANHIANALRDLQVNKQVKVTVDITGAAWSAATIITSAGNPTRIADNALMMIHDPWTVAAGNAGDMRKEADILDKYRDTIVATYKWKSPLSEKKLAAMMSADGVGTWMDAKEAVANGFADSIIEGIHATALVDNSVGAKLPTVPDKYRERVSAWIRAEGDGGEAVSAQPSAGSVEEEAVSAPTSANSPTDPNPETPNSLLLTPNSSAADAIAIVDLCTAAKAPELIKKFVDAKLTPAQVKERLSDAQAIRDACTAAKLPERAAQYIAAGMSIDEARASLFNIITARDAVEIDNKLSPFQQAASHKKDTVIDYKEIYDRRKTWPANQTA